MKKALSILWLLILAVSACKNEGDIGALFGTWSLTGMTVNGQEPTDGSAYVHAISGGTITSQGVQKMLFNSLQPYTSFFKELNKERN